MTVSVRAESPGDDGWRRATSRAIDQLARGALRGLVATSLPTATAIVVLAMAGSWVATYVVGGADTIVPHWYYLPIVFTAARFGPVAALVVAVVSGVLAGPLTLVHVNSGVEQEATRWLSRTAFFVVIGQLMAGLVGPALPTAGEELRQRREDRALREGLERGEFFLVYQPIVGMRTSEWVGVEALVRWQHPTRGELGPGAFLPAAERSEAIHILGAFVLREATRQLAVWNDLCDRVGRRRLELNVNISGRELEAPDLVGRVRDSLDRARIPAEMLCLEVTESVLVSDVNASLGQLGRLKELGVRLAIDDFGTGYSSLAAVHRFPVDILKIDRTFISALDADDQAQGVCGGIVLFARTLGLMTVAEGIETEGQRVFAAGLGCDLGQGFLWARPVAADQVTSLLRVGKPDQMPASPRTAGRDAGRS